MSAEKLNDTETVYMWTDAKILSTDVRINADTSAYLLPKPLTFTDPATATVFVADYPETTFGSVYREAGVFLHAQDEKGPALFCSWMVVDDDTALIGGRESLGIPKKMADISLVEDGDIITGRVIRWGIEVLRLEVACGEPVEGPATFASRRMVNAAGIPLTGMKLFDMPGGGERIHEAHEASGTLMMNSSDRDPLGVMEPASEIEAHYYLMDFGAPGDNGEAAQLTTDIDGEWVARNIMERSR